MRERTDVCGRFAPSPSGRMHLGNVFCAVLAWLSARSRGGRFLLAFYFVLEFLSYLSI